MTCGSKLARWCVCGTALGTMSSWGVVVTNSLTIADTPRTVLNRSAAAVQELTAQTQVQLDLPSAVGTPIFRLDCSQTNGWVFGEGGQVMKVPSLVGTRYLTSDKTDPACSGEGSWIGYLKDLWIQPPVLTTPEEGLGGYGVLDFGAIGSKRGLVFDLWQSDETAVASNILANIGTAIFMLDSKEGGGFILAGGQEGYGFHRGGANSKKAYGAYSTALAYGGNDWAAFRRGVHYVDGVMAATLDGGLFGDWSTVSVALSPTETPDKGQAWGLGAGDMRPSSSDQWSPVRSGGMRIAEMILYSEHLSEEQVTQVEVYLKEKWFKKSPRGWNGQAVISEIEVTSMTDMISTNGGNAVSLQVNVPSGEHLTIESLKGGHFDGTFAKKGAGTLTIESAAHYSVPMQIREGKLELANRAVPRELPTNYFFRIDAARTETVTTNAAGEVTWVTAAGGSAEYQGKQVRLTATHTEKPTYRVNALGAGKHTIDFGAGSSGTTGAYLHFVTNETEQATYPGMLGSGIYSVGSVVAVVQDRGGNLLDVRYLRRHTNAADGWEQPLLANEDYAYHGQTFNARYQGCAYVDGVKQSTAKGYPTPGYHVVAIRAPITPHTLVGVGGCAVNKWYGGVNVAEMVIYDRQLTEAEMKDASAVLMKKWLGRVPPGYQDLADGYADVQKVAFDGTAAEVYVPAGATARVARVTSVRDAIRKTGAGTLIMSAENGQGQLVKVTEGNLQTALPDAYVTGDQIAARPSLHLDATDRQAFETIEENGTNFVKLWHAEGFDNVLYVPSGRPRPWVTTDADADGKQVVDFGPTTSKTGPTLYFGRAARAVQSAYVVWRPRVGNVWMLGGTKRDVSYYDFHRGVQTTEQRGLFRNNLWNEIYTNGVAVTYATLVDNDEWMLVEVHAKEGGVQTDALCADRDDGETSVNSTCGGAEFGEIVLFDRELTAREKIATRNALLKKWFPNAPCSTLPEAASGTTQVAEIAVDAERELAVAADETQEANELTGDKTLTKEGAGTLKVGDVSRFTGTIEVNAGTFALTDADPGTNVAMVTKGCVLHVDATQGVTTETDAAGAKRVTQWASTLNDGVTAVPMVACGDPNPTLLEKNFKGKDVIDFAVPDTTNRLQTLRFKKDGEWYQFTGLGSIYWVFGSQNGGGHVLGDESNTWIRENNGTKPSDNVISIGAGSCGRWYGYWYINGEKHVNDEIPGKTYPVFPLSGGWDLLEWNAKETSKCTGKADGFAFRSTILKSGVNGSYWQSTGRQRLAEVIFYNRVLSEADRLQNEKYLAQRWGLMGLRSARQNAAAIHVGVNGTLDCTAAEQYVGTLSGAGTVSGRVACGTYAYDYAAPEVLNVATLVVPATGFELDLRNLPATGLAGMTFKVMNAGTVDDAANLAKVRVTGVNGDAYRVRTFVKDGGIWVVISSRATVVIMR